MGKKYSFTTEEERKKIKTLYDMGVSTKEIVRITGRSDHIVNDIVTGKYEARKEADRLRKRGEREAALKAKQQKEITNALDTEERKRQETRERIREEAIKAGAPTFDEGMTASLYRRKSSRHHRSAMTPCSGAWLTAPITPTPC